MLTLLARSCGRVGRMWAAAALLLAVFQLALTSAAVSLEESGDYLTLVLVLAATNVASVALMAPAGVSGPAGETVISLMAHLFALTWCFGGLTLAAATRLDRRSSVLGALTVAVIALFLLKVLVEFSTRFAWLRWLTPFDYFQGTQVLLGTEPIVWNLTVLGAVGVAATIVAYWQFQRRDL